MSEKNLRCLGGFGRCPRSKCCFALVEVGFVPAQARTFRAVTFCGYVVLVPLFPFKKLTDQLYFRRISGVLEIFHSCLLDRERGVSFQVVV